MKQHRLEFSEPGQVVMRVGPPPQPAADQVLVQTHFSAISPGTEMLVYRGQWPQGIPVDELRSLRIFHRRVAAADRVAGRLQRLEGQ